MATCSAPTHTLPPCFAFCVLPVKLFYSLAKQVLFLQVKAWPPLLWRFQPILILLTQRVCAAEGPGTSACLPPLNNEILSVCPICLSLALLSVTDWLNFLTGPKFCHLRPAGIHEKITGDMSSSTPVILFFKLQIRPDCLMHDMITEWNS